MRAWLFLPGFFSDVEETPGLSPMQQLKGGEASGSLGNLPD